MMLVLFQHTAARRRLDRKNQIHAHQQRFNTQPPEGGWRSCRRHQLQIPSFNTQPPEGGWFICRAFQTVESGFNTQPPEGGWMMMTVTSLVTCPSFNTQPPEGGWPLPCTACLKPQVFQHTAARRRLADLSPNQRRDICFNTQPPEGGWVPQIQSD